MDKVFAFFRAVRHTLDWIERRITNQFEVLAMRTTITPLILLLFAAMSLTACDTNSPTVPVFVTYDPPFNPTTLQANITNAFFPLTPGTVWTYEGQTAEGFERIVVEVLEDTRVVAGITTRVVHDRVFLEGDLIEDTFDWYAQDPAGNVCYVC